MVALEQNPVAAGADDGQTAAKYYRAAWRWHFYAGLYVIPFFIMLALTGIAMMWIAFFDGRDGEYTAVIPQETTAAVSVQAQSALAAFGGGDVMHYTAPRDAQTAAMFRVETDAGTMIAVVDPYTAQVIDTFPRGAGYYDMMDNIHGELMLGVVGDRMVEIAASLAVILVVTGLYMWWPRDRSLRSALTPRLAAKGRAFWKSLHEVAGIWVSVVLVFFLISGLSWAGIWGGKMVQAWSSFPTLKSASSVSSEVPVGDVLHGAMNSGAKDIPWALELVPMPASGSLAGADGIAEGLPVAFDTIDALARQIGFSGRYQLNWPMGETGVWTLSQVSMSRDDISPTGDRTVHVDQYTGKLLADVRYEDYGLMGKAMAVGVALHMGTIGFVFIIFNTLFCLTVLLLCASGVIMWWKRRPAKTLRLAPPAMPHDMPLWKGAVVIGLALSFALPMAGFALLVVLVAEWLILSRIPALKRALL
ncbi:PepSY-associated TM helix domain-containing protein [Celeribacter sp.]|uniref:PepSY-associated TM helix domain-containing protein n=1 Tax=Celeribacter sp. TaxID=1890673 RepID=UPI003A8DD9C6